MEIDFNTRQLERCYTSSSAALRQFGEAVGKKYIDRLNRIQEARAFRDLYNYRSWRLHALHGPDAGKFAISLTYRHRLIVGHGDSPDQLIIYEVTSHYDD